MPYPGPLRLRCPGARGTEAARSQLGAHRELCWSRLYGNYSGLSQSDENGRTEPNIGSTFDAPLALFGGDGEALYGRLATDRPHPAKAQPIYTFPVGVSVGAFQSVASGVPVSRFAVLSPGIAPVFYAGRGSEAAPRCWRRPTSPSNTCDRSVDAGG